MGILSGGNVMPISRRKLKPEILLHEIDSYEILKQVGESNFENWSIEILEGQCFGYEYVQDYICTGETLISLAAIYLDKLDNEKPFLKFNETGQHYAYELFLSGSTSWGSRGDPFLWFDLARAFSYDKLPMNKINFIEKYNTLFKEMTGIEVGKDEYVYIKKYAHGGMSSGSVGGVFASESLKVLLKRLEKYN